MLSIDKKPIVGFFVRFVAGLLCFLILVFVGYIGYRYFIYDIKMIAPIALTPPKLIPVEQTVTLDWDVKTLEGETVNLKDQFQGKPVFLNLWATWCPPCRQEMPSIESLHSQYSEKVGFACVSSESIGDLQKFKDSKGYTMPIYHLEGSPPEALNVKGIPVTYIITEDRKFSFKHIGGANWAHADVMAYFENLLSKVK